MDEVFADYPLAPKAGAVQVVAAGPSPALTFSLGGLSKGSGLPQLKLGWIAATGPEVLVASAIERLALILDTYLSVGTPVQLGLGRVLELGSEVRQRIHARVRGNRALVADRVGPGSPCTLLPTEGGWSAILRLPAVLTDEEWAVRFAEEDGVLVSPGYFYDLDLGASVVLGLLPDPAVFSAAVARLLTRAAAA